MIQTFIALLIISLSTASVLFFLSKPNFGAGSIRYSAFDLYDAYRRDWMPERCEPCFSLWIGTLMSLVGSLFVGPQLLLTVLAIPPIAIYFYQYIKLN